jgi:hypothetical protein
VPDLVKSLVPSKAVNGHKRYFKKLPDSGHSPIRAIAGTGDWQDVRFRQVTYRCVELP